MGDVGGFVEVVGYGLIGFVGAAGVVVDDGEDVVGAELGVVLARWVAVGVVDEGEVAVRFVEVLYDRVVVGAVWVVVDA